MLAAAPLLRDRRRAREEAEKRRREEEMRRYEEQQRAQRDGNRWRHFVGLARRWQDAEIARQFLAALESKLGNADATFDQRSATGRLEWGRERLASYDPLAAGADAVFKSIADVNQWTYRET